MPPKKPTVEAPQKKKVVTQTSADEEHKRIRKQVKTGLILPVGRIYRQLKNARLAERVSSKGAVSVAAVLEYLIAEILELSGDVCTTSKKSNKGKTIKPRHIMLGIREDEEIMKAIGEVIIPNSGKLEDILPELKMKKKKKKKTKVVEEED